MINALVMAKTEKINCSKCSKKISKVRLKELDYLWGLENLKKNEFT